MMFHIQAAPINLVLGSKVDKLYEISIKTLNTMEYIKSDTQNIETPIIDDPIIKNV